MTQIPIFGPLADAKAEISSLAWYGDDLILLHQYPDRFSESGYGAIFYLPKSEIISFLDNHTPAYLTPRPIELIADDLEQKILDFQGFEAIEFYDDQVFLTIESGEGTEMMGYLIEGEIELDVSNMDKIPPQAKSANHTDESILVLGGKVITFYEVNGKQIVTDPVAHVFDLDLNPIGVIPMENIEYRLTDTTPVGKGEFWGINYFFPGDVDLATPSDPISERYGTGQRDGNQQHIERLVKFKYSAKGIHLMNEAPVYLQLDDEVRNWEGLALLDERGFLMATDKYPTTMLAYVAFP